MARGQNDPGDPEDGPILSPEELDITENEHVAEIEDGRFVVSPNDPIGDVDTGSADESEAESADPQLDEPTDESRAEPTELTEETVRAWLGDQFEDSTSRYGFHVTGKFDGSINHRRMASNDVVTIFESLMLWYAQQIDGKTPVEEVLGILLMEANVPIRYPESGLKRLLESTDLGPEDSVADLIEAVDDQGFRL